MWTFVAVLVVAGLLSAAVRPKMPSMKAGEVKAPVVQEGKKIRKIYGTVWIDDAMVLGFKKVGTKKIEA